MKGITIMKDKLIITMMLVITIMGVQLSVMLDSPYPVCITLEINNILFMMREVIEALKTQ